MLRPRRLIETLSGGRSPETDLGPEPSKEAIRAEVSNLKAQGLCGRRVGEQRLGPYFIAHAEYGQREIDLLEEVLQEEYDGVDMCVRDRRPECSRLRGGCKGNR